MICISMYHGGVLCPRKRFHEHGKVLLTWKSYMTMEKVHIVERFLEIGKNL